MAFKILVIDDDAEDIDIVRRYLNEYDIIGAHTAAEALSFLRRPNNIDLVLLDVKLPDFSGTELLIKIKEIDGTMPVIIFTGYSSKDIAINALKGRADDYIEKPLNKNKVNAIISKILEKKVTGPDLNKADTGEKVEIVERFLKRNAHKNVTLGDASSVVCLSPKYLSRVFKEKTGVSFVRYKQNTRLEFGKNLLCQTKMSIAQISEKIGYHNPESFIRLFTRLTGLTPKKYRVRQNTRRKR